MTDRLILAALFCGFILASLDAVVGRAQMSTVPYVGTLQADTLSNTDQDYYVLGNDLVMMVRKGSDIARQLEHLQGRTVSVTLAEGGR